ncbi:thioredoxin-dependent thiol peroxidase [Helicobacter didelphidarum]|uniref:Putative peroxiredoxin bcp n=1 Tax=Helicobacter didelphidarum TaxID=2040648 RepID=A0A3D8IQC5_9HELI|nr:thioredoxin-dependent thiol peroxidase [Helicobacter didelphidarum]RDU67106.1 thioredoxin-dependent thiol peroxidase [Helicobacter didelphidarum]
MERQQLKSGDVAPNFSLPNEDNVEIALQDIVNYTIVLYFYPKDNTSGCTTQAQEFSALKKEFEALNVVIIGISPDKSETHKKFIDSHSLNIILLSDVEKKVATKYHAYGKKLMYGKEVQGIIRSTFIIKDNKIIESFYNVKAKGHAQKILDFLTAYKH